MSNDEKPNIFQKWLRKWRKLHDFEEIPSELEPTFYSATRGGKPEEQFVVKDRMTSYTSAQRSSMVMQILQRAHCDDTEKVSPPVIAQQCNAKSATIITKCPCSQFLIEG